MRLRICLTLLSAASMCGVPLPSIHAATAKAAPPLVEMITEERDAADAALHQVVQAAQQQWTHGTVEALLQSGSADDIAMAAHLNRLTDNIALVRCTENGNCDQRSGLGPSADATDDLVDAALVNAEQLSVDLLRSLLGDNLRKLDAERQDQLVELLIERAPDDVHSWLLKLHLMIERNAAADELTRVLNQAAASVRGASEWFLVHARRVDAAYARVPAPPGMLAAARAFNASKAASEVAENPDDIRRVHAFGVSMAVATPGFGSLPALCRFDERLDPARRSACTTITRTLAVGGQSALDRGFGLAYWHMLVEGMPEEANVIALKRAHYWQTEVGFRALNEPYDLDTELSYMATAMDPGSGNEISQLLDALREAGIPTEPPPEWLPQNPDVLLARR